jgi:hypothetical protein
MKVTLVLGSENVYEFNGKEIYYGELNTSIKFI